MDTTQPLSPVPLENFSQSVILILVLILLYYFGIWSRRIVFPTHVDLTLFQQLVVGVPTSCFVVGAFAKGVEQDLLTSASHPADWLHAIGTVIVFGMLSRESMEKLMKGIARDPTQAPPPQSDREPDKPEDE